MPYLSVADTVCGCMGRQHPLRRAALIIARSPAFDAFILLNILFSFALLGADDGANASPAAQIQTLLEPWFASLYWFEALAKLVALGPRGYFTDGWCAFDFTVVVLCSLALVPGLGNASGIRALRALRPLRSLSKFPSLRRAFGGILAAAGAMLRFDLVNYAVVFTFALAGLQLWGGAAAGGCEYQLEPVAAVAATAVAAGVNGSAAGAARARGAWVTTRAAESVLYNGGAPVGYCSLPGRSSGAALAPSGCAPVAFSAELGGGLINGTCVPLGAPLSWRAPPAGSTGMSFDNFGIALLTSFMASTEEGWTTAVYGLWATWGWRWLVSCVFMALVIAEDVGVTLSDALISHVYYAFSDSDKVRAEAEAQPEALAAREKAEAMAHTEMWGTGECGRRMAAGGGPGLGARAGAAAAAAAAALGRGWEAIAPTVPPDVRYVCQRLVGDPRFDYFFLGVVVANIACMALQYRGATASLLRVVDLANAAFVFLFTGELLVRVVAVGVFPFFKQSENAFDAVVVGVSLVDVLMVLCNVSANGTSLSALRSLRLFRALRMLKVARAWRELSKLLTVMRAALVPIGHIFIILCLAILVFAVVGMQLFGGRYADALAAGRIDEYPRGNFDNLYYAMITVFTCVEGENWFVPLYQHSAVEGPLVSAAFFVLLRLVGGLMFGLVLGVFMRSFDEAEEEETQQSLASELEEGRRLTTWVPVHADYAPASTQLILNRHSGLAEKLIFTLPPRGSEPPTCFADTGAMHAFLDGRTIALVVSVSCYGSEVRGRDFASTPPGGQPPPELSAWQLANEADAFDVGALDRLAARLRSGRNDYSARHAACGFLPPHSALRRAAAVAAASRPFEFASLAMTLLSCVNLALEEPWLGGPECGAQAARCAALLAYLDAADVTITGWFAVELAIKAVAQGVYGPRYALMRSWWNVLDAVVLLASIASLAAPSASYNIAIVRALRALRVVRAARLFKRVPALLVIAETLANVGASAPNALAVVLLFMLMFAVVGQQLFSGTLNACNDPAVSTAAECVGNWTLRGAACALLPSVAAETACRAWDGVTLPAAAPFTAAVAANATTAANATAPSGIAAAAALLGSGGPGAPLLPPFSFPRLWEPLQPNWDNLGNAMLQVFLLLDGENWPSFMYATMDGDVEGARGLSANANPTYALYFIVVVLMLESVVLDVFTGVVRSTFTFLTSSGGGRRHLTRGQRRLLENAGRVLDVRPHWAPPEPLPGEPLLWRLLHAATHAPAFAWITRALHGATLAALIVRTAVPPPGVDAALTALAFAAGAEQLLKVAAWGAAHSLLRSHASAFDGACSLVATAAAVALLGAGPGAPADVVLRVALALRCALLVFEVERAGHLLAPLEPLLRAAKRVAPQVAQVFAFQGIVIFVYAVVGMAAFGSVRHGVPPDPATGLLLAASTGNLNEVANFESFPVAFFTLFRGHTGENWNQLMFDLGVAPPYCTAGDAARGTRDGCGTFVGAVAFWVSFKVLTTFIIDAVLGATVLKALWEEVPPSAQSFLGWADPRGRRLFVFTHAHGNAFRDAWAVVVDSHGEGFRASRSQVASIMLLLPPPMGLRGVLQDPAAALAAAEEAVEGMTLLADGAAASVVVEEGGAPAGGRGIHFHLALHALVLYASKGFEKDLGGGERHYSPKWDLSESHYEAQVAAAARAR